MRTVLPLIDAIYEAVLDTDKWSAVLEMATDYFAAHGAQIGNSDLANSRLSFSLVHGYDWSAEHMLRYESLMSEDPRLKRFSANPFKAVARAAPVSCSSSAPPSTTRPRAPVLPAGLSD